MGDDEKEKKGMWGASIPTGGGWENLPVGERIRQTFERGITRAELDLADAFGKGIKPGAIPEVQQRRTKEIAREFGAQMSVHAPYQVEFSSPSLFQQAEAGEMLKQSIKYAKDMGAHIITVHPTSVMGGGFRDPFTGQLQVVPGHLICKSEDEFDEWTKEHGIDKGTVQHSYLYEQWRNFFAAQSTVYAQQQSAARPIFYRDFADSYVNANLPLIYEQLKSEGKSDTEIKAQIHLKLTELTKQSDQEIGPEAQKFLTEFEVNKDQFIESRLKNTVDGYQQYLQKRFEEGRYSPETGSSVTRDEAKRFLEKQFKHSWQTATVASGGRLNEAGTWQPKHEKQIENFRNALAMERVIDLKGEEGNVINNLKKSLEFAFKDKETVKMIKEGKITIALENLYGVNGKTGWLNGFAYYTRPEHLKKAIEAAREVAKEYDVPADAIGFTFDTEHAAIVHNQTPTQFIDKMNEFGIKITSAHLVGGSASTGVGIFGHKGFGSIEDEIMRKNPELLKKIQESGAPITIEPGSGGIKDVEDALETMRTGAPMEALMAANQAKALEKSGYIAVKEDSGYFQPQADMYSAMVNKGGFYSFGPSVQQPFKSTFGSFASPSLYGGGILHRDTPTNIWGGSQPLSYSTKTGEEGEG